MSRIQRFGWGIIGVSGIADKRMLPGIRKTRGGRLAAVMSRSREKAELYARKYDAAAYDSVEALLADPSVDIVYVSSPVNLHHSHVLAAAAAGKHVLCEKPLALTLQECDEMAQACEKAGVKLMVGFMMRFHPLHLRAKRLLEAGALGKPILARAQLSHFHVEWNADGTRNWRQEAALSGGGSLMDMGIHCFDLLRILLGEIKEISAFADTLYNDYAVEDSAAALLRFESGAQGIVDSSFALRGAHHVLEIYGTEGSLRAEDTIGQEAVGRLQLEQPGKKSRWSSRTGDLYRAEAELLHGCIGRNETPVPGAAEGRRALELVQAAYKSSASGQKLDL